MVFDHAWTCSFTKKLRCLIMFSQLKCFFFAWTRSFTHIHQTLCEENHHVFTAESMGPPTSRLLLRAVSRLDAGAQTSSGRLRQCNAPLLASQNHRWFICLFDLSRPLTMFFVKLCYFCWPHSCLCESPKISCCPLDYIRFILWPIASSLSWLNSGIQRNPTLW